MLLLQIQIMCCPEFFVVDCLPLYQHKTAVKCLRAFKDGKVYVERLLSRLKRVSVRRVTAHYPVAAYSFRRR